MEEREASVASLTDFYDSDRKPDTPGTDAQNEVHVAKRKAEELEPPQEKKRKLDSGSLSPSVASLQDCAGLPPQIWQNIFLYCSVRTLGRLLQVNRSFHSYLTNVHSVPTAKPKHGFVRLLKSESIWAAARNAHPTKPPTPLPGFSEVQMWRLIKGTSCQFCGKKSTYTSSDKPWLQGPGETGVRIIWPFAIRSCGPCLLSRSRKESTLLFSDASALRPALPFALVTANGHYVSAHAIQHANIPPSVEITKCYYTVHVEEITQELKEALSHGPGAAEEWSKGLEFRGKKRMRTSDTWERWETKYQWWINHQEPKKATSSRTSPFSGHPPLTGSPARHIPSPLRNVVPAPTTMAATSNHRPPTVPPPSFTPQPSVGFALPPRSERNLHDANEAKAARKAEIERRCQLLDPPILPNVLRHMESFRAAIQISQPLTYDAWQVLEPRLVAQQSAAEQAELEHVSRLASLQTRVADRRQQDASLKEVKEVLEREWEEAQKPIRDKLSSIADEFIERHWDNGNAVTFETTPKFAADLLTHVRKQYYAAPVWEDASDRGSSSASTKTLILENMKWVYDNKVKPLTEQFRKELFVCNGCDGNNRYYGFEGVIQHYGAKHTNTFSVGNVVVAWREAEWPEEPPFHPDPVAARHSFHPPSGISGQGGYGASYYGYRAGTATPHVQVHLPQASPGPYHTQFGGHFNGPYAPPASALPVYDYALPYGAPPPVDPYVAYQPTATPYNGPAAPPPGFTPARPIVTPNAPPQPNLPGLPGPDEHFPPSSRAGTDESKYRTNLYDNQVGTVIRMIQEIWKQTSGVKDLPNSVRVHVLMHSVISKFQLEFNHEPVLDHFIDALSNHEIPKSLKHASGLFCKVCQIELSSQSRGIPHSHSEDARAYTVLNLFLHFKSQHYGYGSGGSGGFAGGQSHDAADWKEDMIELPSRRVIAGLLHASGMDDEKLHVIATVFPSFFPTPLPRIAPDVNGFGSPAQTPMKDSKENLPGPGTPGFVGGESRPSTVNTPFSHSPGRPKPQDEEYDPQRPALPSQPNQAVRISGRPPYRDPPPAHYIQEPIYSRGQHFPPTEPVDTGYIASRPREYVQIDHSGRVIRHADSYEGFSGRAPFYTGEERLYQASTDGRVYALSPQAEYRIRESRQYAQESRPQEDDLRYPEYHVRDSELHGPNPSRIKVVPEQLLRDLDPTSRDVNMDSKDSNVPCDPKAGPPNVDLDNGSRYTPPPPSALNRPEDRSEASRPVAVATSQIPTSATSNGPRLDDYRPYERQVPTPESGRRGNSFRRRDKPSHDYVPARYYRYMSVARDEQPYSRSVSRTQNRRYSRYEQEARRLNQEQTPQPGVQPEYVRAYSPDRSFDRGRFDDGYRRHTRHGSREFVPMDEPHAPPPVRYQIAGEPAPHAPSEYVLDQYGRRVELVPLQHEPLPPRGSQYVLQPSTRYVPETSDPHYKYVSVGPYERAPSAYRGADTRYDEPPPRQYVYYEERDAPPPHSARRRAFEPEGEGVYEPVEPPVQDVKAAVVPGTAPVPPEP